MSDIAHLERFCKVYQSVSWQLEIFVVQKEDFQKFRLKRNSKKTVYKKLKKKYAFLTKPKIMLHDDSDNN